MSKPKVGKSRLLFRQSNSESPTRGWDLLLPKENQRTEITYGSLSLFCKVLFIKLHGKQKKACLPPFRSQHYCKIFYYFYSFCHIRLHFNSLCFFKLTITSPANKRHWIDGRRTWYLPFILRIGIALKGSSSGPASLLLWRNYSFIPIKDILS